MIVADDNGVKLLDSLSTTIPDGEQVAVMGESGSGVEILAQAMMRLLPLTAGGITVGGHDLAVVPESVIGRSIGYAGPEAYLFPLSVRENIIYAPEARAPAPGGL